MYDNKCGVGSKVVHDSNQVLPQQRQQAHRRRRQGARGAPPESMEDKPKVQKYERFDIIHPY